MFSTAHDCNVLLQFSLMWRMYGEQHSRADYNNFLVYQSYLLQLQWVCFALAVTEQGNLKLRTLEERKRRRNVKRAGRRREKKWNEKFWYQQETESERGIYTDGDIRGSENKGGAVHTADCGGVPIEKEALTWLYATQLAAVTLCCLLYICSTQRQKTDNIPPTSCVNDVENCIARSSC